MPNLSYLSGLILVCGITLLGCATYDLRDPVSVSSIQPPETPEVEGRRSTLEEGPCEPCWRKIVYRGTVTRGPFKMEKVAGARVSLFEGGVELCSTRTGAQGDFDLECEVYGTPCEKRGLGEEWRPEPYYALVAESPAGQKITRVLRDLDISHPLILDLD